MKPVVSIIMGSTSDLPVMEKAAKFLDEMEIPFEMHALSAHRTPAEVETFAKGAKDRGIKVIIDGVFNHSGYMQDMVAYTDEQKKVIETLQKAFKDAKECGLQCLVGDDHLRLINVNSFPKYHITDSEWDCEDDALDVYFTKDVAMVEGVYRNYGDSPVLVVD